MFTKTLSSDSKSALAILGESKLLKNAYLAGGTALALQIGHRQSIDFDFFTSSSNLGMEEVAIKLRKLGRFEIDELTSKTINGFFNNVRFSLFDYLYPLIRPLKKYLGIDIASCEDISAMKLVAITDRGTKKDFIDLYFIAKQLFSTEKAFEFYDQKYALLKQNRMTLLKSLQYFSDADESEMPVMLQKIEWSTVKTFFKQEALRLWKDY